MRIIALCHTCQHQHKIDFDPLNGPGNELPDWVTKHPNHAIDFVYPGRSGKDLIVQDSSYMGYLHNADLKISYGTEVDITITLTSLGTSSTKVAGRASTAIDNTTNRYLDGLIKGKVTTGTSPTTAKSIDVYAYGQLNDTPAYPDSISGSDAAKTMTTSDIRNAGLNFIFDTATDGTSDQSYFFKPVALAGVFGGILPPRFGIWVTHDTAVNLNSTGSNHEFTFQPVYASSIG